jgi:hypothetical protein
MGDPLTVVVLVAAGGAAEPTTLALERAANDALGHSARVVVHEATGTPTDGEALAAASEESEAAVVEVTWSDRGHRVATLRAHLPGRRRWTGRTLGFNPADADSERGRAIGLALVSMLPDPDPAPLPPEAPAPRAARETPPQAASTAVALAPSPPSTLADPEIAEKPAPDLAPSRLHYALDFVGLASTAVGGSVQTAGGAVAFEGFLTPAFAMRIGGAMRGGPLDVAAARTLTLLASAGLALSPWPTSESRIFGASLRADYVLMNQTVTHYSSSGTDISTMARPLSGIDAVVEAELRLGASVDVVGGMGVEEMLARTYVDLNGTRMATLPPLSALAEVGLRLRF